MKYPFVKQYDSSDCAAACMAMICKYYKKDLSIAKLRDLMGTDMKGTNVLGLTQCATHLNLQAQALMVDREGFFSDFTLPARKMNVSLYLI